MGITGRKPSELIAQGEHESKVPALVTSPSGTANWTPYYRTSKFSFTYYYLLLLSMKKFILFTLSLISYFGSWATDVKVDFITSGIVRVQWAADGALKGNNTGVCIWQENSSLTESKVTEHRENGFRILVSEALTVRINEHSGEIEFIDTKS